MAEVTNTELGAASELKFLQACLLKGVPVFTPACPTQKDFDCLIEIGGVYKRVQVKTGSVRAYGNSPAFVRVTLNGARNRYYERDAFDYLAIVCHELDKIWLVPVSDLTAISTMGKSVAKLSEWDRYLF